jgi:hypothetical protein
MALLKASTSSSSACASPSELEPQQSDGLLPSASQPTAEHQQDDGLLPSASQPTSEQPKATGIQDESSSSHTTSVAETSHLAKDVQLANAPDALVGLDASSDPTVPSLASEDTSDAAKHCEEASSDIFDASVFNDAFDSVPAFDLPQQEDLGKDFGNSCRTSSQFTKCMRVVEVVNSGFNLY